MTNRYRKKPVEVEAIQILQPVLFKRSAWPRWLTAATRRDPTTMGAARMVYPDCSTLVPDDAPVPIGAMFVVNTPEGVMYAEHGSWLIQGVEGEIYPCKDSVFKATYEVVE